MAEELARKLATNFVFLTLLQALVVYYLQHLRIFAFKLPDYQ